MSSFVIGNLQKLPSGVTGVFLVSSRIQNFLADQRQQIFHYVYKNVERDLEKYTPYIFLFFFLLLDLNSVCQNIFHKILSLSRKIFFTLKKRKIYKN